MKRDLSGVSKVWARCSKSASASLSQSRSTQAQSETHFQVLFTVKRPSSSVSVSRPPSYHASRDRVLARLEAMSLTNPGSFNLPSDLRIPMAQAKTLS